MKGIYKKNFPINVNSAFFGIGIGKNYSNLRKVFVLGQFKIGDKSNSVF